MPQNDPFAAYQAPVADPFAAYQKPAEAPKQVTPPPTAKDLLGRGMAAVANAAQAPGNMMEGIKGAIKGGVRTAYDPLSTVLPMPQPVNDFVHSHTESSNPAQTVGSYAPDVAMALIGAGEARALPAVQKGGQFLKAAAGAGGRDVVSGIGKAAAGAVADYAGVPAHVGTLLGIREGLPQIGRGIRSGFQAGREALIPKPPALPVTPTIYDDIAKSLGAKSFESAGPQGQAVIEGLANKAKVPTPIRPTAPMEAPTLPRAEHPPFAKDRPFPKAQKIREQSPQPSQEELGIHGGVENTPRKPLDTPAKLKAAQALKRELNKGE